MAMNSQLLQSLEHNPNKDAQSDKRSIYRLIRLMTGMSFDVD
jgi:hypothetical protein